ncbi:MAG: TraR/DksA family transcriptional regulator [Phycisphaera sp.]|nr:TraR/DksA family transcriptional regulator [Phycisphaera sp.]
MAKKASTTKKSAKKTTKKAVTKKTPSAKKAAAKAPAAKKPAAKKSTTKKSSTKKATTNSSKVTKKVSKKDQAAEKKAKEEAAAMAAAKKAAEKKIADAKAADAKKNSGRKGITIVDDKPKRRQSMSKPAKVLGPPPGVGLLGTKRKPLIASGPKAPESQHSVFGAAEEDDNKSRKKSKTPFNKRELDKYREILINKRRELVGDVSTMEMGVLNLGNKSGDPATDVAEQGSDAYDQSLSIGLAEVDRKLIREIDAAIKRIDDKVYGLCEITGNPIPATRLNELPWARLSIEAARELERRGG